MDAKETATATLAEFFTHLDGSAPVIEDLWEEYDHMRASKRVGERRYYVDATVDCHRIETVGVRIYDFSEGAKRSAVANINVTPALAARFTLEAIDAYEAEMDAA